jgi:hypothetical protein
MTNQEMIAHFQKLADIGKPINDDDWGSERQITAQNYFFGEFDINFPELNTAEFEHYCNKARTEEMFDEAMRLIRNKLDKGK